jgi:hypothetical protein
MKGAKNVAIIFIEIQNLTILRTKTGKGDPLLVRLAGETCWRIEDVVEGWALKDPLPHAVL